MEPDVPFALLATAQLLAVAAFAGLAAEATTSRARRPWALLAVLGGLAIATAEAITAADLGASTGQGVGWLRAGGAVALAVWFVAPTPQQAGMAAVAPLAAAAGPSWVAAAGMAVAAGAALRSPRSAKIPLVGGLALCAAAAAFASGADHSSGIATTVLVLRLAGVLGLLVHLGLLARRSVLTKVVAAILGAVTLTGVAAASVVGTTVTHRLGDQQRDRVRQAAVAEAADIATQGEQSSVFAAALATADPTLAVSNARAVSAALFSKICSTGGSFFAQVESSKKVDYYEGSECGARPDPLVVDDLANQAVVQSVLAPGGGPVGGAYVVLHGVQPVLARIEVARPDKDHFPKDRAAPAVQIYAVIVDQNLLTGRKNSNQFDTTVIAADGRLGATTLPLATALDVAANRHVRAALTSPPVEGTAAVSVSSGREPTLGIVALSSGNGVTSALLVLSAPADQVTGVQSRVLKVLVIAIVLIGFVVALLGLVLGQRIAGPVRRLTAAVERVRRGDRTVRTGVTGDDEVAALGRTFDAMTESLAAADEEVRASAAIELATRVRLETVLASMSDGLVVSDPDGIVTSINPAAEHLLGEGAVGSPLTAVVRGSGPDGRALVSATGRVVEGMLFRQHGPPVAVAVSSSPLSDGQGSVLVMRDMTRDRQVEQMKTEFLSNVSHELRTPLTPIQGYAEILSRRPDLGEDKIRQYSEVMYDSAKRLSRIVDQLVDVAALDAGRVVPEASDVDLRAFIDKRLDVWRVAQPKRAADLRKRVGAGLPHANVDPLWLAKAVDELIDNAVKFSEPGTAITLGASLDAGGGVLRLSVRDAGRGLDAAARAALFSDFEQGDGSATRSRDGLGLGLSFARRLAGVLGASLDVESAGAGKGSTFSLLVPTAAPAPRRRRAAGGRSAT